MASLNSKLNSRKIPLLQRMAQDHVCLMSNRHTLDGIPSVTILWLSFHSLRIFFTWKTLEMTMLRTRRPWNCQRTKKRNIRKWSAVLLNKVRFVPVPMIKLIERSSILYSTTYSLWYLFFEYALEECIHEWPRMHHKVYGRKCLSWIITTGDEKEFEGSTCYHQGTDSWLCSRGSGQSCFR